MAIANAAWPSASARIAAISRTGLHYSALRLTFRALLEQRPDTISAARAIAQLPSAEARRPLIEGVASGALTHRDIVAMVRTGSSLDVSPRDGVTHTIEATSATTEQALPRQDTTPDESSQHSQRPVRATESAFARALERDVPILHGTIARWRLALPKCKPEERAYMHGAVKDCIDELQNLLQALEQRRSGQDD